MSDDVQGLYVAQREICIYRSRFRMANSLNLKDSDPEMEESVILQVVFRVAKNFMFCRRH